MTSIDGRKWVYVFGGEPGHVKIGVATDLNSRRSQYRTHNPSSLVEHFVQWCSAERADAIEREVKRRFAERCVRGEWFSVSSGDAVAAVREVMTAVGQPPLSIGLATVSPDVFRMRILETAIWHQNSTSTRRRSNF